MNTIGAAQILIFKSYRQFWGDVGVSDIAIPAHPIEKAKQEACDYLINQFNSAHNSGDKPHTGQLVDDTGKVVAQFDVRPVVSMGNQPVEVPTRDPAIKRTTP